VQAAAGTASSMKTKGLFRRDAEIIRLA
jgi:hypothetical protein